MRAISFHIASAPIPFRAAFGHAAATRHRAENVLVRVDDADGRVGLGEGCPRAYVTGETLKTAHAFLRRNAAALSSLDGVEALRGWLAANEAEVDKGPSAFCAAELALLDLFARRADVPIEVLIGLPTGAPELVVSAVYGAGSWWKFRIQTALFAGAGMGEAKLKVSGRTRHDFRRVAAVARRGRVRLDANNLWPDADSAVAGLTALAPHAWAVEEPVRSRDWAGMAKVRAATGLAIIADESVTRAADLDAMPREGFVPNLRVSKLGGLLRAAAVLKKARAQGRAVIVGAQVGETSILARAGAALAAAAGESLRGVEVGYGTRLLRWDLVEPELRFGIGGRLDLKPFAARPGLGLTLNEDHPSPIVWETIV